MRTFRVIFSLFVIALLAGGALPMQAQGKGPEPVGLRPDAPEYAKHGPYWVGIHEFVIPDKEETRPLPVAVWYPALNPKGVAEAITYTYDPGPTLDAFTLEGHAIDHAAPDLSKGPYPLVIFTHGNVGFRYFYMYVTEHLASHGFVVLALDHTGNTIGYGDDPELAGKDGAGFAESSIMTMAYRPGDIQRTIDYAATLTAKDGSLAGLIDMEHIGVMGHSYGGTTSLIAGGARVDFTPGRAWCKENADNKPVTSGLFYGLICDMLVPSEERIKEAAGVKAGAGEMWPAFDIKGVDAIVPLSPTGVWFTSGGAKSITVPTMIMNGSADSLAPIGHVETVYKDISSEHKTLVVFDNAGHGIFPNKADKYLIEHAWFEYTSDLVWDMDRAHDLTNHFTTAFLLDVLKGDKEAHKALLPDAVKFLGIDYKTTMK